MTTPLDRLARDISNLTVIAQGPPPAVSKDERIVSGALYWALYCPTSAPQATIDEMVDYLLMLAHLKPLPDFAVRRAIVTACEKWNPGAGDLANQCIDEVGVAGTIRALAENAFIRLGREDELPPLEASERLVREGNGDVTN